MPRLKPPVLSKRALPANVADLEAQRVVKRTVTLLDEVEAAYLKLYDDLQFQALRGAEDPDKTVEGSTYADDTISAQMIREKAVEMELSQVVKANLTEIAIKLRAAERRVNASRNQRRQAVIQVG